MDPVPGAEYRVQLSSMTLIETASGRRQASLEEELCRQSLVSLYPVDRVAGIWTIAQAKSIMKVPHSALMAESSSLTRNANCPWRHPS
jgi:hypothetical protein